MHRFRQHQHSTATRRAFYGPLLNRLTALVVLISAVTVGISTPISMAQPDQQPKSITALLCFEQGPPERSIPYNLLQLLAANGVVVVDPIVVSILPDVAPSVSVLTNDGELFLVADPPGGVAQVIVEAKDANTSEPVAIEINLHVISCPNLPAPPSGNNKPALAPVVPAGTLPLCIGEQRGVYFAVVTLGGGFFNVVDPARITKVQVVGGDPTIIDIQPNPISADQPAAFGWLHFTGLAKGNVTLEVTGQAQPVGLSPFTDDVTTTLDIAITDCPAPAIANNPCPALTIRAGNFTPSAQFVAGAPAGAIPGAADGPYVGMERFEVGFTPAALQPPQWDFPSGAAGVINLARGERRVLEGVRTDFFVWALPFPEPVPPDPARRLPAKWVAYRGYLDCQVPPVPVIVWKVPPIELLAPNMLLPVHFDLPPDIGTVIGTLGAQPRDLPESQRNESNKVFRRADSFFDVKLNIDLDEWSGDLWGVACSTDVFLLIVKVCSATVSGIYKLLFDVLKSSSSVATTREVVAQLQVEIEIVPLTLEGSSSSSKVQLKVTACVLAPSGFSKGSWVSVEPGVLIAGNPKTLSGSTSEESEGGYKRLVTKGSTVTLTAPMTHVDHEFGALEFNHWRNGEPPGGTPITGKGVNSVTTQLNENKTLCAIYKKE